MAVCPSCRAQVPEEMLHCGQCGSSMKPPAPAAAKRTMMGLTGVDQKELQRAIEAARAATAAGETPKKQGGRRTMMGVAAVSVQAPKPVPTPEPIDDTWAGEASKTVPSSPAAPDPIDEGWGLADAPIVPAAAAPASSAAAKSKVRGTMAISSMSATAPVRPAPSSPLRGTVAFGAASLPPAAESTPATTPRATAAFEAAPPTDPRAIRATAELGAISTPIGPATKAPSSAAAEAAAPTPARAASAALRGTALLGAMAEPPSAPATGRPTTGARPQVETASRALAVSSAPLHPAARAAEPEEEGDELELADTVAGRRALAEALPRKTGSTPGVAATDPLADTLAPGALRRDDLLGPDGGPKRSTGSQQAVPSMPASTTTSQVGIKKVAGTTPPPFLASKALVEDMFPTEPERGTLRVLLIVAGILLPAVWIGPALLGGAAAAMPWETAGGQRGVDQVLAFATPALGALFILLGLLPLPYRARAFGGLVLGLGPLLAAIGGLGPVEPTRGWPGALLTIGMVLLPGALLHRANYRASVLARILVALGVVLVLAWMFVPGGSAFLPTMLSGFSTMSTLPQSIVMVVTLVLVAASLLAYMTSATTGGTGVIARLLLFVRPALSIAAGVAAAGTALVPPVALAATATLLFLCNVIACFGMAQSLAALEERPRTSRI